MIGKKWAWKMENGKGKYLKSNLSDSAKKIRKEYHEEIETCFIKAFYEEFKLCIGISINSLYKYTTVASHRFKCTCIICHELKGKPTGKSFVWIQTNIIFLKKKFIKHYKKYFSWTAR